MGALVIEVDDPRADDVRGLLERHLAFAHEHTPAEYVHALDLDGLLDPAITFFSARRDGRLLAVGALKELDPAHGELKSMHTLDDARRQGVGGALLNHLVSIARDRGYERVSLETGTPDAFVPARTFYARAGFTPTGRFGDYPESSTSAFLTLALD